MIHFLRSIFLLALTIPTMAMANAPIIQLNIEGAIHEGTVQTIEQALIFAKSKKAQALLITLDTPGGMLESTRKIVKLFLNESEMPIVVYVSPTGSRAGSAGTFITLAAHIAAMAPGTNIGAAHPVTITGKDPEDNGKHMAEKIQNDTVAFMGSITQQRNRNSEWPKKAILESSSIGEVEAKKINVIDEIATDAASLIKQLDGKNLQLHSKKITLNTQGATIISYVLDFKSRLLNLLAHPTTIMILMTIVGLGLYAEFSNPGLIFPAVAAVISIFLLLIANSVIPMTAVGRILIFAGFICLLLEIYVVSFGLLTVGGLGLFIAGALLLFDPTSSDLKVPYSLIFSIAGGIVIVATIVIVSIGKTIHQPQAMGAAAMIGQRTRLVQTIEPNQEGKIFVLGEYWNAVSSEKIEAGTTVEITHVIGLTVSVKAVT